MTTMLGEEWGKEVRSALCDPHALKVGEESHIFCYWKKRWASKSNRYCITCQFTFFETKRVLWGSEQTLFSFDVVPHGQNGSWKPSGFSCQHLLLCLHLNQVLGPNSLLLACPLLVSTQPI